MSAGVDLRNSMIPPLKFYFNAKRTDEFGGLNAVDCGTAQLSEVFGQDNAGDVRVCYVYAAQICAKQVAFVQYCPV